jgi:hypothetical protein
MEDTSGPLYKIPRPTCMALPSAMTHSLKENRLEQGPEYQRRCMGASLARK